MKEFFTLATKEIIDKYAGQEIYFKILEVTNEEIIAKVTQKSLLIGKVLTQKELIAIGKEVLKNEDKLVRIKPLTFTLDIRIVTPEWVQEQMKNHNIRKNDIVSQLHIDKHILNSFLKGNRNISRLCKAGLFWFFFSRK